MYGCSFSPCKGVGEGGCVMKEHPEPPFFFSNPLAGSYSEECEEEIHAVAHKANAKRHQVHSVCSLRIKQQNLCLVFEIDLNSPHKSVWACKHRHGVGVVTEIVLQRFFCFFFSPRIIFLGNLVILLKN